MEYPSVIEFETLYANLPTPLYDELMEISKLKGQQIIYPNMNKPLSVSQRAEKRKPFMKNLNHDNKLFFSQL